MDTQLQVMATHEAGTLGQLTGFLLGKQARESQQKDP
jgi:hypothetical protein